MTATMALRPFDSEKERQMTFRLYEMTTRKGASVLQQVLEWGTFSRQPDQSFADYLFLVKKLSRGPIRKKLSPSQWKKVKDHSLKDFDITLLYLCIQYGCDGLGPPSDRRWAESGDTLEYNLTLVKNFRNAFLHEEFKVDESNFLDKTEELRNLLNKILKRAAEIYNKDQQLVDDILQKLSNEINSIRDESLDLSGRSSLDFDKLRQHVNSEGKLELKRRYRDMSSIGPVSNLLDKYVKIKVRIDKVFTKILMKEDDTQIRLEDLLALVERRQNQSQTSGTALLVEGPAGVGKTTLTRKMISDWASGASTMENLQDYEFAILVECRAREIHSLSQLLQFLLPNTSKLVRKDYLLECIQDNRLLFIVDGLDELNSSSEQVYREILKLGESHGDVTVLCTTRPNKVPDFKRCAPNNFNIIHVHVLGIAEDNREEFVNNYSQALGSTDEERDISGLLCYLNRKESRLQDHWRFPFNLVFVTVLWVLDPEAVNRMTTATELFLKTHELCQSKLRQRLFDHEKTWKWDFPEMKEKMDKFLKKLYEEALINHCCDDTVLSKASVQRLRDACDYLDLPVAEILSTFLVQATSLTEETEEKYSFPHKGIQDFFSALHVMESLIADNLDIPRIISGFRTVLSSRNVPSVTSQYIIQKNHEILNQLKHKACRTTNSIRSVLDATLKEAAKYSTSAVALNLVKWQNILVHLTGLLYLEGRTMGEETSAELVSLLKGAGVEGRSQWLNLLSEVKCEATVSKYVARAMDMREVVRVTDCHVAAYASVLPHTQSSSVEIHVTGNPRDVPRLTELLMVIKGKTWPIKMEFQHDFRHPKAGGSILDEDLRQLFQQPHSRVLKFKGQLSAAAATALPRGLQELQLALLDDAHYRALQPLLSSLPARLPPLKGLLLHVAAGLSEAALQPLPRVNHLGLVFDHVRGAAVAWASGVARKLQPAEGYPLGLFPGLGKSEDACFQLLEELSRRGVRVRRAVLVSPAVAQADYIALNTISQRDIGCKFLADDEETVWREWTSMAFSTLDM
ncbi:LOW QUALITY PROTEIN: uncharacterized protein LOC119591592 [Penaeus monodon]|uniref:LOW QUALITY PROTEIN: uncharacterized protein LOC119591592 n=1 Tax=Penaeus monodon TaxID=6687 RepID=UPI0018A6F3A4|nr:LOW QUALITY PROTEIN: uncharacterized protein LOC119591592 [Penaeus monodon]